MNELKLKKSEDDEIVFKVKASPYFWRLKSEESKFAAEILWSSVEKRQAKISKSLDEETEIDFTDLEPDLFSIFLSLIGFSTECLFKGVAIRNNPLLVSNGKLNKQLKSHDLIKLAKLAKIQLSQHEEIFCKQAFKAMVIDSRYPIPLEVGAPDNSMEIGGHCKDVFSELYKRLYPMLEQIGTKKKKDK